MLITACILITTTAFAQKGYYLQFAIQPGSSSISGDWKLDLGGSNNTFEKGFTFSFETGVNGGYNFTDNLGVSIGLFYASQGQNYKEFSTITNDISLSYLKIPFKLNFTLNPENQLSFSGFAGFYLGFLTAYNQTMTQSYNNTLYTVVAEGSTLTETISSSSFSTQYDFVEKPFNSTNFGITLGAGVQKKLTDDLSIQFMLNYQAGFGDIKNVASQYVVGNHNDNFYDTDDPNRTVSHKNSVLGLIIGITKRL